MRTFRRWARLSATASKARHEEITDGNETIDRGEALAALFDYFSWAITQDKVIEIIRLYFAG